MYTIYSQYSLFRNWIYFCMCRLNIFLALLPPRTILLSDIWDIPSVVDLQGSTARYLLRYSVRAGEEGDMSDTLLPLSQIDIYHIIEENTSNDIWYIRESEVLTIHTEYMPYDTGEHLIWYLICDISDLSPFLVSPEMSRWSQKRRPRLLLLHFFTFLLYMWCSPVVWCSVVWCSPIVW